MNTPNELRVASSAIVTSLAQIATMLLGGVIAVVVVLKFGAQARTDAFFAAYGVYSIAVILAQSARTTIVARLVEGASPFDRLDRFLAAGVLLALAFGIPTAALGGQLADLLTANLGQDAEETARNALLLLWPAAGLQIISALGAAALAVRGEFALPGLAYVAGTATAIGLIFVFDGPFGVDGASLGLVVGSGLTAVIVFARLVASGYRPRLHAVVGSETIRAAWQLAVGAVGYIMGQMTFVVSVALAARLGEGAVTVYTYAFFAASLVMGAVAGPIGIVLAAPIASSWDRRPESLRPFIVDVARAGLVFVLPVLGVAALIGEDVVDAVLGAALSGESQESLVLSFLALGGMLAAGTVAPVPTIAVFVRGRYLAAAVVSVIMLVVHLGLAYAALQTGALPALALATSATTVASLVVVLWLVYGRRGVLSALALLLTEIGKVALLSAFVFVPLVGVAQLIDSLAWRAPAVVVGIVVFAFAVRRWLPAHWELLLRVVQPAIQRVRVKLNMPQA